jgi:hypothetical protein
MLLAKVPGGREKVDRVEGDEQNLGSEKEEFST